MLAKAVMVIATAVAIPIVPVHDHWINFNGLKDPASGEHCCNENDCKPIDNVQETMRGYYLPTTDELIPSSRVLWRSPDGKWYRCHIKLNDRFGAHTTKTRCLIGPMPSA